jgi:hypothetical protein
MIERLISLDSLVSCLKWWNIIDIKIGCIRIGLPAQEEAELYKGQSKTFDQISFCLTYLSF